MTSILPSPDQMLAELAKISQPGAGVTRLPLTKEHRDALELLENWMQQAGLETRLDAAGTLIGYRRGTESTRTLFLGSHQDSVRNGGAFDGAMGVVLPICAMAELNQKGRELPFSIEVLAFADEEGVRFPTALMGPRCLAGTFDTAVLEYTDEGNIRLEGAIRDFGLDPSELEGLKRNPDECIGYVETHIEQGPVLESRDLPVGIVTAICGIERHAVTFTGEAGHAGTVPMSMRKDALAGAAEFIVRIEQDCKSTESLLGCVGSMSVQPGVVNAVPGEVKLTLELRAPDDAVRESAAERFASFGHEITKQRNLQFEIDRTYSQDAVQCADSLSKKLGNAAAKVTGSEAFFLPSGATHDASAMSSLTDVAMLFVRCRDGVSHSPQEWAQAKDLETARDVFVRFLENFSDDWK